MRLSAVFCALLLALSCAALGADGILTIEGPGIDLPPRDEPPCPVATLRMNHDGTTENALTLHTETPVCGSMAEGYGDAAGTVCGIRLLLTRWASMSGECEIDLLVWDYEDDAAGANPGAVLSVTPHIQITGTALWPEVSTFDLDCIDATTGPDGFFVGYWPRGQVGLPEPIGCAMDQDGPGGVPRINICPDEGPTGWMDPGVYGWPVHAFGIGAWFVPAGAAEAPETGRVTRVGSWGAMKRLYR